jgi:hypothetical protein
MAPGAWSTPMFVCGRFLCARPYVDEEASTTPSVR